LEIKNETLEVFGLGGLRELISLKELILDLSGY